MSTATVAEAGSAAGGGRYEIVREIGRGGMAVVYLARQRALDRDVALKELHVEQLEDSAAVERFHLDIADGILPVAA